MAGATVINATVLDNTTYGVNVWLTALLCAVFVLLAYGRRLQIKGLPATIRRVKNDGRRARPPRSYSGTTQRAARAPVRVNSLLDGPRQGHTPAGNRRSG
jgi:hypothetical protein